MIPSVFLIIKCTLSVTVPFPQYHGKIGSSRVITAKGYLRRRRLAVLRAQSTRNASRGKILNQASDTPQVVPDAPNVCHIPSQLSYSMQNSDHSLRSARCQTHRKGRREREEKKTGVLLNGERFPVDCEDDPLL